MVITCKHKRVFTICESYDDDDSDGEDVNDDDDFDDNDNNNTLTKDQKDNIINNEDRKRFIA